MSGRVRGAIFDGPERWAASANRRAVLSLPAQFLRYLACAGLAALVNFAAGSVLVEGFGFTSARWFAVAVVAAYGLGMLVNFLLNRHFTFASDRNGIDQARTFVLVALSGLALTTAIALVARAVLAATVGSLAFLPLALGSPEALGRGMAIALAALYSFVGHRSFTFNRGLRYPLFRLVRTLRSGGWFGHA